MTFINAGHISHPPLIADLPNVEHEINQFMQDKLRAFNDEKGLYDCCESLIANNPQVFSNKSMQEVAQIIFDWFRDHFIVYLRSNKDFQVVESRIHNLTAKLSPHFPQKCIDEEIEQIIRTRMRTYHWGPIAETVQRLYKSKGEKSTVPLRLNRLTLDPYQHRELQFQYRNFFN